MSKNLKILLCEVVEDFQLNISIKKWMKNEILLVLKVLNVYFQPPFTIAVAAAVGFRVHSQLIHLESLGRLTHLGTMVQIPKKHI
jgi:hypothetical protein